MTVKGAPSGLHRWIFLWGTGCVLLLLGQAVWRLTPLALEPLGSAGPAVLVAYFAWVVFMAYSEGYRGFHQRFSPRVVARAYHLGESPTPLRVLLALPFCMSLFHTTRKQRIVSWTLTLVIVGIVVAVRQLPQPWRGVIDGGVVIGLTLGAISILYYAAQALVGRVPKDAALPSEAMAHE